MDSGTGSHLVFLAGFRLARQECHSNIFIGIANVYYFQLLLFGLITWRVYL
jgi:hypothetical protein